MGNKHCIKPTVKHDGNIHVTMFFVLLTCTGSTTYLMETSFLSEQHWPLCLKLVQRYSSPSAAMTSNGHQRRARTVWSPRNSKQRCLGGFPCTVTRHHLSLINHGVSFRTYFKDYWTGIWNYGGEFERLVPFSLLLAPSHRSVHRDFYLHYEMKFWCIPSLITFPHTSTKYLNSLGVASAAFQHSTAALCFTLAVPLKARCRAR